MTPLKSLNVPGLETHLENSNLTFLIWNSHNWEGVIFHFAHVSSSIHFVDTLSKEGKGLISHALQLFSCLS